MGVITTRKFTLVVTVMGYNDNKNGKSLTKSTSLEIVEGSMHIWTRA